MPTKYGTLTLDDILYDEYAHLRDKHGRIPYREIKRMEDEQEALQGPDPFWEAGRAIMAEHSRINTAIVLGAKK